MKHLFLLLATTIVLASSCITQQKCNERFPPNNLDSISIFTIVNDSLIEGKKSIKGDTVVIHDTLKCPELEYHKEVKNGRLTEKIDISNGVINASCKEDSLKQVNDSLIRTITTLKVESKHITEPPIKVNELTKIQGFLIVCGWLFWILILLLIIALILKMYFKIKV